jgi:predicted nucleic acid-binding protein
MVFCFDTSGLNELYRDAEREPIVTALLSAGSFLISAHNVAEAIRTKSDADRVGLLRLMTRLARNTRILDRPSGVLRRAACSFAADTRSFVVNADPKLEGLWQALHEPEQINEDVRDYTTRWLRSSIGDLGRITPKDRATLTGFYEAGVVSRPRSAAASIRGAFADQDHLYKWFAPKYESWTTHTLSREDFERLVVDPTYALYLGGIAYGVYQRAMRLEGYSQKGRHANLIDLGQAVYLPLCDSFVTHDVRQYRALRLLNRFNTGRKTEVLRYQAFRRRLLVG